MAAPRIIGPARWVSGDLEPAGPRVGRDLRCLAQGLADRFLEHRVAGAGSAREHHRLAQARLGVADDPGWPRVLDAARMEQERMGEDDVAGRTGDLVEVAY